ncbi:hypothetical protein [Pararhodobacter aggregans]|uniref:hypothetical protein n=1 Tax=Pararhodobacter aggregans TaxID=404875 RepID=UPI001EDFE2B7|nr:hypothetical protein [Pararhodobacter aggregans]
MVDVKEQHGIRGEPEQRIAGGQHIRRAAADVAQEEAGAVTAEPGVPERQPQGLGGAGQGGGKEEQAEEEAGAPDGARGKAPWWNRAVRSG